RSASDFDPSKFGFRQGTYLGLLGHLFLFITAIDPAWSTPPWPLFGALAVLTLALTATSIAVYSYELHAAGAIAASIIVFAWAGIVLSFVVVWAGQWDWVAPASVVTAWWVHAAWHDHHTGQAEWTSSFALAAALYLVYVAHPIVLGRRARGSRDPYLAAIVG